MHKPIMIILLFLVTLSVLETAQSQTNRNQDPLIRLSHFAADVDLVDIYLDGTLSAANRISRWEITSWYSLPVGVYELSFVPSGQDLDAALATITLELTPNSWHTISLIGTLQRDTIDAYVITERSDDLAFGEARLLIFHAIEGWEAVDMVANNNALLQFLNFPGTFTDAAGRPNDGFVSLDVVANRYQIAFVNHQTQAEQLDIGRIALIPNYSHFIALIGTPDNANYTIVLTNRRDRERFTENSLYLTRSETDTGRLRVAHFSSGTPSMDVYINNRISIIRDLAFTDISPFVTLPTGTYRIDITPEGLPVEDSVVDPVEVEIEPDTWTTVAFTGTLLNDTLGIQVLREDFAPIAVGETRISLLHVNPEFGAIDLLLPNGDTLLRQIAYPGSLGTNTGFAVLDIIAGTYELEIVSAVNPSRTLINFPDIRLLEGRNTLIALINADPPFLITYTGVPGPPANIKDNVRNTFAFEADLIPSLGQSRETPKPSPTTAVVIETSCQANSHAQAVLCEY